jgi:predicted AAA+ superfamily ATPase
LERLDLEEVLDLIDSRKYFVLHAPRQTGKTSCLLALVEHLNRAGRYRALYANIEAAQALREDVAAGIGTVVQAIASMAWDASAPTS